MNGCGKVCPANPAISCNNCTTSGHHYMVVNGANQYFFADYEPDCYQECIQGSWIKRAKVVLPQWELEMAEEAKTLQMCGACFAKKGKEIKEQAEKLYRDLADKLDEAMQQQADAIKANNQAETMRLAALIQRQRIQERKLSAYAHHIVADKEYELSMEELMLLKFV